MNVDDLIIRKKLEQLPSLVRNLVYIGNYIEQVKGIRPAPLRRYYVYYIYFFGGDNISIGTIADILLSNKEIWKAARKAGYFFLNKSYYLSKEEVTNFLRSKNKLGLEDVYYVKLLLEGINNKSLAVFLSLVKYGYDLFKNVRDKEIREYIQKFEKLGLIKRSNSGYIITKKGWKVVYMLRDLLELLGEKDVVTDLQLL